MVDHRRAGLVRHMRNTAAMAEPGGNRDELWKVVRKVEATVLTHTSECSVRNAQRDKWEAGIEALMSRQTDSINSLNSSRSQMIGLVAGASAAGSIVGALLSAVIPLLFGK